MAMSTDEYVPSDEAMEVAWIEFEASAENVNAAAAEFDRFLARVRRDAAREALDGLINERRIEHEKAATSNRVGGVVLELHAQRVATAYRDTYYPEAGEETITVRRWNEDGSPGDVLGYIKFEEAR